MDSLDNLNELFEHELKDVYDAEQRILKALEKQASEVADAEVAEAFEEHLEETKGQVERLERVFDVVGVEPETQTCHGIVGLLREREEFIKEDPSTEVLHTFNLGAAAKVELYEISAYEGLIRLAEQLDLDEEVTELLLESLEEEEAHLERIEAFLDEPPVLSQGATHKARAR